MDVTGRNAVHTQKAPAAIGPYSQGIKVGSWLYCSGQIPWDVDDGQLVSGDVAAQTQQVLKNLSQVVAEAGGSLKDMVTTTIFLKNLENFHEVNRIYSSFFSSPYPARSTVEVARLPKDVDVEIEAVVYIP